MPAHAGPQQGARSSVVEALTVDRYKQLGQLRFGDIPELDLRDTGPNVRLFGSSDEDCTRPRHGGVSTFAEFIAPSEADAEARQSHDGGSGLRGLGLRRK